MIRNYTEHQNAISDALKEAQRTGPLMFERITDSAIAGNLIGKQPADFYVLSRGHFFYLEAKFSEVSSSLRSVFSGAVKAHQLAAARKSQRAGGSYFIFYYSSVTKVHEVWDGVYCRRRRSEGKPLEPEKVLIKTEYLDLALNYVISVLDHYETRTQHY